MNLGPAEILVILVLALLVFGPKRLPEVGRQVGGALREIRKVQSTVQSEINEVLREPTPTLPPAGSALSASGASDSEPDDHEADTPQSDDDRSDRGGDALDGEGSAEDPGTPAD